MSRRGAQRVAEEELRGVTSNPAIFAKALQQGDGYDRDLAHAAALGQSPQQIYEELVTTDIRNACAARATHAVVVVEDHASNGGLGDASCPELEIPCVSCFRISPRRF
jgi:transaldolase